TDCHSINEPGEVMAEPVAAEQASSDGLPREPRNSGLPYPHHDVYPSDELACLAVDKSMPIAIVGIGFRGPGEATNVEKLSEMILTGREAWTPIPAERWNNAGFYHPDHGRHGTINVEGGHFMQEDVSLFDAPFFNMTSDEAAAMDPQQRLLLEVTYEGLESDYTDILLRDPECMPMYQCTNAGQSRAMTANRVSYFFDLKGPSVTVDTACSGSLVALHMACQSLCTGDASTAIAAGVNLVLSHEFMSTMSMMKFLSPDGRCYTFDERANGYGRGEAVGCLILKPLSHALRDSNTVRAVIRGTGTNQDGRTPGITLPSGTAQETLIRDVYARAGLSPSETDFVEAHGTGTQAGDPIETGAISRVFGPERAHNDPLRIGSIKTNVGHLEGASGVAGVIKAVLMLESRTFFPNRNFKNVNPRIPLEDWKLKVQTESQLWETTRPRRVSVNSFGYGGSNAHAIIEDAQEYLRAHGIRRILQKRCKFAHGTQGRHQQTEIELQQTNDARSPPTRKRIFMLSAFDEQSCLDQSQNLHMYLLKKQQASEHDFLEDLSFTLNERRSRFMWKTAVVADSIPSLIDALSSSTNPNSSIRTPTLGFVFTGQGAQWAGMGKELLDAYPVFKESIAKIDAYLRHIGAPFSARGMLCPNLSDFQNNNVNSGALSMEDAMAVAYYRGVSAIQLSVEYGARGAMMAIAMDPTKVQPYLDRLMSGKVVVACINSPSSVTVSGDIAGINELEQNLHDKPVFNRRLAVDVAYHSHHMELIAMNYLELISDITPRTQASIPDHGAQARLPTFFSSVTGKEAQIEDLGPRYWVSNLLGQVSFAEAVKALCFETNIKRKGIRNPTNKRTRRAGLARKVNVDCLLEVGPHSALAGPIKQILQADPKLNARQITYASTLTRKVHAVTTALKVTALLASLNYPVDFGAINSSVENSNTRKPQLLIDLPQLPWLADHKIQSKIVYPAAGYIAMAIEASLQLAKEKNIVGVVLRDILIEIALVVSETAPVEIMLSLREIEQTTSDEFDQLHNFYIYSVTEDNKWTLHCTGVVGVQSSNDGDVMLPTSEEMIEKEIDGFLSIHPETETPGISVVDTNKLYDQLHTVGMEYGPCFANLTEAHVTHDGTCFGEVTVPETENLMPMAFQYPFLIHPCTLDSIFHTIFAALPAYMGLEQGPAIPVRLDEMRLSSRITCLPGDVLSVCTHVTLGPQGDVLASIDVVDQNAGHQGFDGSILIRRLRCRRLDHSTSERYTETSNCIAHNIEWKPDPEFVFYRKRSKIPQQVQGTGDISMPPFEMLEICAANFLRTAIDAVDGAEMKEILKIDRKYLSYLKETVRVYEANYPEEDCPGSVDLEGIRASGPLGEMLCMLGDQFASGIQQHAPTLRSIQTPQLWDIFSEIPSYQQTFAMATGYLDLIAYKAPEITILEIGAGMGETTKLFLQGILDRRGMPRCLEYTFTNPDKYVVEKATEQLKCWADWVSCKQLDVEHDLAEQGFSNSQYDVIIIPHGLLDTLSTHQALSTIKHLLAPSGYLIYIDLHQKRHNALEDLIFGPLYNYQLGDMLEDGSSESNQAQWAQKFDEVSLSAANIGEDVKVSGAGTLTICKHKMNALKRHKGVLVICEQGHCEIDLESLQKQLMMLFIDVTVTDITHAQPTDRICIVLSNLHMPLLSNCDEQTFKRLKDIFLYSAGVLWVTRGGTMESTNPEAALATGFARTARSESGVSSIITLDLDSQNPLSGARITELIFEMINCRFLQPNIADNDTEYAEREGKLFIPRVVENAEVNRTIHTINETETLSEQPFRQRKLPLRAPRLTKGTLSNFFLPDRTTTEIPVGYVGVEVQSFGISERDIQEHYQTTEAESTLGLECSGTIYALGAGVHGFSVGDRVACFGVGTARSLYHDRASAFQKMDDEMPFELAAAVPVAYCTAYYVVHHLSQIECNNAVLILDAASWFGQAIVDMCCVRGAKIFATVTTAAQRTLLTSRFAIPPNQIFDATEHFTNNILRLNGRKKVNIAINCGDSNDRSFRLALNCVASFGQVIQVRSQTSNTNCRFKISSCPKNISYSTFNLFELRRDRSDLTDQILSKVFQLFRAGRLHGPSSIAMYNVANIAEALRSIPLESHVVVGSGPKDTVKVKLPAAPRILFCAEASYLLVGGLGGIGRVAALWMAERGARSLVFVSRSGLSNESSHQTVRELEQKGVRVTVQICDVASEEDTKQMMLEISQRVPPIRGLIQAAMVLKDVHIENMTLEDYHTVLQPKVAGTWNLHRNLPRDLDFFVMLSSISGVIGNATQAAYAAGSTFMDSLAGYRNTLGLHAVSLDLGTVTDVGYLAENRDLAEKMTRQGFHGTDTSTVMSLIEAAILQPRDGSGVSQIVTGLGQWKQGESLGNFDAPLFSHFRHRFRMQSDVGILDTSIGTLREGLKTAKTLDEATRLICEMLIERVAVHLTIAGESVDPTNGIAEYGVDSHVAIELRDWISKTMDSTIPILEILASGSLLELAGKIASKSQLLSINTDD
ncbi:hypothetical protein N7510_008232, partial [Penicillium lagena]|uniref:uncharacterized protein n=1 Tax=Penicillium lagena TaxID=94218 RepID=UPI002540708D